MSHPHSPLPWKHVAGEIRAPRPNGHGTTFQLADCWHKLQEHDSIQDVREAEANADFIVQACNSHAALVAALKGMMAHAKREGAPNMLPEMKAARAALKLAKG